MARNIKEEIEVLYPSRYLSPHLHSNDGVPSTSAKQRFSQLLLEHGETHLQDWGVVASSSLYTGGNRGETNYEKSSRSKSSTNFKSKSKSKSKRSPNGSLSGGTNAPVSACMKSIHGRLRLCTKSIVFEPDDPSRGIIRCPFDKMDSAPHAATQSFQQGHDDSAPPPPSSYPMANDSNVHQQEDSPKIVVLVRSNRHFVMKKNNVIAPFLNYEISTEFRFMFLHSSPKQFFSLSKTIYTMLKDPNPTKTLDQIIRPMLDRPFDPSNFQNVWETPLTNNLRTSLLTPLLAKSGCTIITNERLYFQPSNGILASVASKASFWNLSDVIATARRYRGLKDCALEIFFHSSTHQPSVLLAFESSREREQCLRLLAQHYRTNMRRGKLHAANANGNANNTHPRASLPCHTDRDFILRAVNAWNTGDITNFDYLLALNSASGRTFHDLSRYPVFPWIIGDYQSSKLTNLGSSSANRATSTTTDLSKDADEAPIPPPNGFRDLTKPIGALNEERLANFQSRYKAMQDMEHAFLYGTHYSAPGYVLYYLVRSMPEHMLCLQNGKYDAPDRLFYSLDHCYNSLLTNPADLKESIPQFYDPKAGSDFLINVSGLQLGVTQNGIRVNDVQLPPWAKSPKDFLKKNRKALESDYCSQHLHHWIDLIFGEKSRGDSALQAMNLFHPMAYLNSRELETMASEQERVQAELQATEFGIVPDLLFCGKHPAKSLALVATAGYDDGDVGVDHSFVAPDSGRAIFVDEVDDEDGDDDEQDRSGKEPWEILDAPLTPKPSVGKDEEENSYASSPSKSIGFGSLSGFGQSNKISKYANKPEDKYTPTTSLDNGTDDASIALSGRNGSGKSAWAVDASNPFDDEEEEDLGNSYDEKTENLPNGAVVPVEERIMSVASNEFSVEVEGSNYPSSMTNDGKMKKISLSGTGNASGGTGTMARTGTFNMNETHFHTNGNAKTLGSHYNDITEHSSSSALKHDSAENQQGWKLKPILSKKIHGDAVSGCCLSLETKSYITTTSLDGGLMVHTLPNSRNESNQGSKRRGFSSFSYLSSSSSVSKTSEENVPKLHSFRSHTSADPLACLATVGDSNGGYVAFAGGHDDVVLAYGINSACALASVYSHRDAVTGIDLVPCPSFFHGGCTHIMVSGSWDATVKLWSVSLTEGETVTIDREPVVELYDADSSIVSLAAKDVFGVGLVIAAGCSDGSLIVWSWDSNGGKSMMYKEEARRGYGSCSAIKWMVDPLEDGSNILFVGTGSGRVVSYTLKNGSMRPISKLHIDSPIQCLSTTGQELFAGCADGGLRLLPLGDGAHFDFNPRLWKAVNGRNAPGLTSLSVVMGNDSISSSSHERTFMCASGSEDGTVALYEMKELPQ